MSDKQERPAVTCDGCGMEAPAGLLAPGRKHHCGGTWNPTPARSEAAGGEEVLHRLRDAAIALSSDATAFDVDNDTYIEGCEAAAAEIKQLRQQLAAAESRYDQVAAATGVANFDDKVRGGFLAIGQSLLDRAALIDKLKAENVELWQVIRQKERDAYQAANALDVQELDARCAELGQQLAAAREAVREYGVHHSNCQPPFGPSRACTCGLDAARSEPSGEDSQC